MADKLTAKECATLPDGKYTDGDGLRLIVRGDTRAWTLLYTSPVTGKRRELGLGKLSDVGLAQARSDAAKARDKVRAGVDPIEAAAAARAASAAIEAQQRSDANADAATLRRVARAYHETKVEPVLTRKHAAQWIASIEQHVPAKILDKPITEVKATELLDALHVIFVDVPETGRRVKQRLDAVFDHAVLRELALANPVKIIGRELRHNMRLRTSFRALPFDQVRALVKRLRGATGSAARALEFAILTAARTSEVLEMEWSELARDGKTWTVPAARMKAGEPHVVYLSGAARAVLARVRGDSARWVFRSPVGDRPLSNMAMLVLLKRFELNDKTTVHGLCRSSFSTWANETGAARPDVIEACLAHQEGDRVRRAYNRAQFIAERRELLEAWARFAAPMPGKGAGAKVHVLGAR